MSRDISDRGGRLSHGHFLRSRLVPKYVSRIKDPLTFIMKIASRDEIMLDHGATNPSTVLFQHQYTVRRDHVSSSCLDQLCQTTAKLHTPEGGRGIFESSNTLQRENYPLPSFVRPPPTAMTEDDLEYLQRKDALTIPVRELRKELLRCHIQYVHGHLPLMDLCDFLSVLDMNNDSLEPVSLLLFQAVMFTGAAFIELEYLQRAGFENRKVARQALFQRVKVCTWASQLNLV